jgi:hypothetical protein
VYVEGIVVFTNKHATIRLNNPTVLVLEFPQLPNYIIDKRSATSFTRQQLEAIAEEILKQES